MSKEGEKGATTPFGKGALTRKGGLHDSRGPIPLKKEEGAPTKGVTSQEEALRKKWPGLVSKPEKGVANQGGDHEGGVGSLSNGPWLYKYWIFDHLKIM